MTLEPHPYADLIPAMTEEEYRELREDIRTNGLRESITLYEGKILDGRHRARACAELGMEPATREYEGDGPAAYVISLNLKRRDLTLGQRSMIAVEALPALEAESKRNSLANLKQGDEPPTGSHDPVGGGAPAYVHPDGYRRTSSEAGALVGVSGASVRRAKRLRNEKPELAKQVKAGEMTLTSAYRTIAQPKVLAPKPPADPEPRSFITQKRMPPAAQVISKVIAALRVQAAELKRAVAEGPIPPDEAAAWNRDLDYIRRSLRASTTAIRMEIPE